MDKFVKISEEELRNLAERAFTRGSNGFDTRAVAVEDLLSEVKTQPLTTPAESRTGISDTDAELMALMGATSSGIRSTLYRVTNNRPEPLAPLEHARTTISKAMDLLSKLVPREF